MRHGEGEHALIDAGKAEGDAAKTEAGRDLLDPRLTARPRAGGRAARAPQAEGGAAFELVVTSPLCARRDRADRVRRPRCARTPPPPPPPLFAPAARARAADARGFVGAGVSPDPPPRRFFVTSLHTETGVEEEGSEIAGRPCQKGRSPRALAADFPALFDFGVLGEPDTGDSTCWGEGPGPTPGFAHPHSADDRLEVSP